MATINYTTLQLPEILWKYSEVIQETPHFEVRRYKHKKGIIFRVPRGAKEGQTHHAFMEHEINLSNTLRTGTLTMKIQITFVPCHMGVFSGYSVLKGSYQTQWDDEFGEDLFIPDYKNDSNVKNIVPLPPNIKSNLYEYLNEILFSHVSDADIISRYAVDLGCQKEVLHNNIIPIPEQTSTTRKGIKAFNETFDFFNSITSGIGLSMLPEYTEKEVHNKKWILDTLLKITDYIDCAVELANKEEEFAEISEIIELMDGIVADNRMLIIRN